MPSASPVRDRRRRGYGLVELLVSVILLAVTMTVVVQMVGWVATERKAFERRQAALAELSNQMERLAARPWSEITPELAGSIGLSPEAKVALPGGRLDVAIDIPAGDTSARRVRLGLRWPARSGELGAPLRLVAWFHRRDGETPR